MIIRHKTIMNNGLMGLINKGLLEIEEQGFGGDGPVAAWDQSAVSFQPHGLHRSVGIMVYRVEEQMNYLFVFLSYIHPEWRCQGIFKELWGEIRSIAVERGVAKITSVTAPSNKLMRAVNERLGRVPVAITYEYDLKSAPSDAHLRNFTRPPEDDFPF